GSRPAPKRISLLLPHLEKLIVLSQRMADCLATGENRYDTLLDEYEEGETSARLSGVFDRFRAEMAPLLPEAFELSRAIPRELLDGHYPVEAQKRFNREVAAAIGFDFEAGRIDTTAHPFCTELGPRDCRLTTRYDETNFLSSLYGVLHEAGHGLYNLGLREDQYGLPMGSCSSLGIHESQSRLWENHIGRTPEFWALWHEKAVHHFPDLKRHSAEQIARFVNRSEPSFIRVEADELTYDLHIILRFEIERRLIGGELAARDLPGFWNEEFEKTFGLNVPDDAHGCLQDIHWSMGGFGYFPTYTLGNMNAAQLMRKAHLDHPHLPEELARGHYSSLLSWLRDKIHSQGRRFEPQALMQFATGEETNAHYHVQRLKQKIALLKG
ncbi:carboxypeptidase M32, partial [Oscillatoria laete-virens NRMC-F 0139]